MNSSLSALGGLPPSKLGISGDIGRIDSARDPDITNKSEKPVAAPPPLFSGASLTIEEKNTVSALTAQKTDAEDAEKRMDIREKATERPLAPSDLPGSDGVTMV